MPIEKVARKQSKIKVGLSAVSGAGKTYSALLLAYGLTNDWTKICLIDSENESSRAYADLGEFSILALQPPYEPERCIEAIEEVENDSNFFEVIIFDSFSSAWEGRGGVLEIMEQDGGKYGNWAKMTPRWNKLMDKILYSNRHFITTTKRKSEHVVTTDPATGKIKVSKVGTKEIIRDNFEYNLWLNFEIDMEHKAIVRKDRTHLFDNVVPFVISKATGEKIKEWCEKGVDPLDVEISRTRTIDEIQLLWFNTHKLITQSIEPTKIQAALQETIKKFRRWNMIHTQLWLDYFDTFTVSPELSSYATARKPFFINFPELQKIIKTRHARLKGETVEELNLDDDYKDLNEQTSGSIEGALIPTVPTTAQSKAVSMPELQFEKVMEDMSKKKTKKTLQAFFDQGASDMIFNQMNPEQQSQYVGLFNNLKKKLKK
jgi:hypothetical protein